MNIASKHIPRLYHPHPVEIGQTLALSLEQTQHLCLVLRLGLGDRVLLFTPQKGDYGACISAVPKKKAVELCIDSLNQKTPPSLPRLHLFQSLIRLDRMDWIVQKATELGVHRICPLLSDFSNISLNKQRTQERLVHWEKITIHAAEQCGRIELPAMEPPQAFSLAWSALCAERGPDICHFFMDPRATQSLLTQAQSTFVAHRLPDDIVLWLGPEGGFSASEWAQAQSTLERLNGSVFCAHLGPRILRAETAALSSLSILQAYFGDRPL